MGISEDCQRILGEHFNMLEVPVPGFQEPDSHMLYNLRCTEGKLFCGDNPRNNWVWVKVGEGCGATRYLQEKAAREIAGTIQVLCSI